MMKPVRKQRDAELTWNLADCIAAVQAFPQGHKALQYMMEMHACEQEQARRARVRAWRRDLATHLHDPLAHPQPIRHRIVRTPYAVDRWRTAARQLAGWRRYGLA